VYIRKAEEVSLPNEKGEGLVAVKNDFEGAQKIAIARQSATKRGREARKASLRAG